MPLVSSAPTARRPNPSDGASKAWGTGLFVLNKNVLAATNDPNDPHSFVIGTAHANDANILVQPVPEEASFLDLFPCISGATMPTSTALRVAVFGFCPGPRELGEVNLPSAISSSFNKMDNSTLFTVPALGFGYWIPLYSQSDGVHIIEFPVPASAAALEVHKDDTTGSAAVFGLIGGNKNVWCAGCSHVAAAVVQAFGGSPTAAALLGRFTS